MIIPLSLNEINKYLTSTDGVTKLFDRVSEVLTIINDISAELMNNESLLIEDFDRYKQKLTGIIVYLRPILAEGEAFRHNLKHQKLVEIKNGAEKVTDKVAESMAESFVSPYYRIKVVLEGYVSSVESMIYLCKDKAVDRKVEYSHLKVEDNF